MKNFYQNNKLFRWIFKGFVYFFGLIFIIVIGFVLLNLNFDEVKPNPYIANTFSDKDGPKMGPLVIAHRGGADLAPEDTMVALKNAHQLGVDVLEMDTYLTKDDILVLHHDRTIERVSDGTGEIKDYTYEELLQFNFGYHFKSLDSETDYFYRRPSKEVRITKLEEVLQQFPNKLMVIEIKDKGERGKQSAQQMMALLNKYKIKDQVILGSFYDDIIAYLRELDEDVILGAGPKEGVKFLISYLTKLNLFKFNSQILIFPEKLGSFDLTEPDLIEFAHKRGFAIHYWTINEESKMKRLIELKADGILTDRPDLLLQLLNRSAN